jgi:hypothetical protein
MTEFIYNFYTDSDKDYEVWENDLQSDEEAEEFAEAMDYTLIGKEELSTTDFVAGWCYYNDEEDYTEACQYTFNTQEQLDNYIDNNGAGGHFSCDRVDHYNGGVLTQGIQAYPGHHCAC